MEVIKAAESNPQLGIRKLAELYDRGKTQISCILKKKQLSCMGQVWPMKRYSQEKGHKQVCEFSDINEELHEWYLLACSKNIYPVGSQLCELIAERLQKPEFKASNGWLDRWKKRYNIKQVKINGESGEVNGATVDSWKEGYLSCLNDIQMRTFGILMKQHALPDHGFGQKGTQCKGGKKPNTE